MPATTSRPAGPRTSRTPRKRRVRAVRDIRGSVVRRATRRDFDAVRTLEQAAFQPYRQASVKSLRRSLTSKRQSVWVLDGDEGLDALLVLWHHPHRLRVYDVASHPARHGEGLGYRMMQHAEALARRQGCDWVSLEADPKEPGLVHWYKGQGFAVVGKPLPHYYHNGNSAVRMVKRVR